jgi:hypothetical protein
MKKSSVADPGCLSRIPDPDFYPSRIPVLGSRIPKQQQKREVKKISCHTFLSGFRIGINLSCWIRIRIRIQITDPDPDPGGQK